LIVVDASAILEVLLNTPAAERVSARLLDRRETLHAPHLLDLEVVQVLRRYEAAGDLSAERAALALEDLAAFPLRRYPHDMLVGRIWELRKNVTAYDAAYLALAEALGATLVTRDVRLARMRRLSARVEVP
jgi:predicted nucleic acid-binding protein